ncbi:MAG: ABC transporter substrate-binding protein [Undibacterium sp.]|nr:ABC transporter substrate-binding protein [Opitutaceae bacterium]
MLHRLLAALLALSSSSALRAAETPTLTPVTYYADWFPGAQFAGVYVAIERGYYRDAGLDVTLVPFAYGQKTTALLDAQPETCGVATSEGYIFLQKRAAGADLKALGAVLQRAPAGFMSLRTTGHYLRPRFRRQNHRRPQIRRSALPLVPPPRRRRRVRRHHALRR